MENKKGQLEMVTVGVMTVMLAGFLLIMGLIILDELYIQTSDTSVSVSNETTATIDNATGVYLSNAGECGFLLTSIENIFNATDITLLPATNYTFTSRDGLVKTTDDHETFWGAETYNVTYTYSFANTSVCSASNATIAGMGKFADYIDLIVLAIVISVVISLLLIVFSLRKVR